MSIDFTEKAKRYQAIDELCEKYAAPIDTDVETNGYFYTDPKYRLWGENQRIIKDKKNLGREAPKIWDVSSSGIFFI